MATDAEFSSIVRLLNTVETAGQARAAAGAALNAVHDAYPLLERLTDDRARAGKTELDNARTMLEQWYATIKATSAAAPIRDVWAVGRKHVERCYISVAGIEGTAGYQPQTSNLSILGDAIAGAPKLFIETVAQAAGTVAKEAGAVAGSAVGGIFSGLGISGTVTLLLIGVGVVVFLKRGTIAGRLLGG